MWGINPDDLQGKFRRFFHTEVREILADYLGEVQAFDAAVGVLLEELKNAGEYDNTLIAASGTTMVPPDFRTANAISTILGLKCLW